MEAFAVGEPTAWPIADGSYLIGDRSAPVAVCVLTSDDLLAPLVTVSGTAIVGSVHTANLGIERIVANVTANPAIRFLLLCGKESHLFRPGQSLVALIERGVDDEGRIIDAQGYQPVLRNVPRSQIERFRRQIELVDWRDERDIATLRDRIAHLAARNPGRFTEGGGHDQRAEDRATASHGFVRLPVGGAREPLTYDPKGFFVITLDRAAGEVVVRHYLPDNSPAHELRGRSPEALALGIIRADLVSHLSHAAYLGAEFAKAQAALLLNLRYEQDRPLRRRDTMPPPDTAARDTTQMPAIGAVATPLTVESLAATAAGETVEVAIAVTDVSETNRLVGDLAEHAGDDAQREYRRTARTLAVRWDAETRIVMGKPVHLQPGALLRVRGTLRPDGDIQAERIAVATRVATLIGAGG